jgi:hypothetical protein
MRNTLVGDAFVSQFDFNKEYCVLEIEWKEFEKVVGEKIKQFKKSCENFMIMSKMFGENMYFGSVCLMLVDYSLFDDFFKDCQQEDVSFFRKQFLELNEQLESCFVDFNKKTEVWIDINASLIEPGYSIGGKLEVVLYKEGMTEKLNELQRKGIAIK